MIVRLCAFVTSVSKAASAPPSDVTSGLWGGGIRFIDRTRKDFHDIVTHTIVSVLTVTDKHYLEEVRPLATKIILERLRKRLENVVSRYRSLLKTKLGKLIVVVSNVVKSFLTKNSCLYYYCKK